MQLLLEHGADIKHQRWEVWELCLLLPVEMKMME